ncbi:MAG TPA: peptidoglycan DD-metalloendopeptidase family protein [Anaerolineales bacterium]
MRNQIQRGLRRITPPELLRRQRWIFAALGSMVLLTLGLFVGRGIVRPDLGEAAALNAAAEDGNSQPAARPTGAGGLYAGIPDLPPYPWRTNPGGAVSKQAEIRTTIPQRPEVGIVKYLVQQGDTLFGIAERFEVKPETLLWGNYNILQDNPHSLRPGQELNVLPVDGTYYEWNQGDRLDAVAAFFGVSAQDIIDWLGNNLPPDVDPANPGIEPGTGLIIPGGRREFVTWSAPRITRANPAVAKVAGPGACGSVSDGPIGEGSFIWPTTATNLSGTPFTSYHPGIDIAGSTGNAIYASASGVVVYAGWNNYGYGLMVVIDHGDGWQTLYAHMNDVEVACGQAVFQGNVIGGVGSTGNSTGPHLHFEMQHDVYGKVNPFDFVSP